METKTILHLLPRFFHLRFRDKTFFVMRQKLFPWHFSFQRLVNGTCRSVETNGEASHELAIDKTRQGTHTHTHTHSLLTTHNPQAGHKSTSHPRPEGRKTNWGRLASAKRGCAKAFCASGAFPNFCKTLWPEFHARDRKLK